MTDLLKAVIEGNGDHRQGRILGVKTLAYRIKKNRKAHFTLLNIDAPAAAVAEMERQMRINEDILRFITVGVEELEDGPSAMLQSATAMTATSAATALAAAVVRRWRRSFRRRWRRRQPLRRP
jgi:ribosomal protein S6